MIGKRKKHIDLWTLTLPNFKKLHQELWAWILENQSFSRHTWPGWENIKGEYQGVDCFPCIYAHRRAQVLGIDKGCDPFDRCSICPIDWDASGEIPCMVANSLWRRFLQGRKKPGKYDLREIATRAIGLKWKFETKGAHGYNKRGQS